MSSFTLLHKTELRRLLDRQWAPYLAPSEMSVLGFIFTTTVEWSKPADRLKVEHFVYGLGYAGGTGLCEKTVRTCLASLDTMGAITRQRTPYGYRIAINFEWEPAMVAVPRKPIHHPNNGLALPNPKKKAPPEAKEIGKSYRSRSVNFTDAYTKEHTRKDHTLPPSDFASGMVHGGVASTPDPVANTRAILDKAKADSKRAADRVKAKGKTNLPAMERLWGQVFRDVFPEATVPVWSGRMQGNAGQFMKANPYTAQTPAMEIFEWVLRTWRTIINARFAWMTEHAPPDLPDMGFLIRWKDRFYEAWNERERLRHDLQVSGKDRRVRKLMHQGLTHEEAVADATERDSLTAAREAVAAKERHLNDMLRRVSERDKVSANPNRFLPAPKRDRSGSGPVRPGASSGGFGGITGADDDF